uniref:Transcriptional regulator ATRX n=1 Tax=Anopheles merus TaxID=30066 RepID=A0A182VAG5_ANOME
MDDGTTGRRSGEGHTPLPSAESAAERMALEVEHRSERFSVPYVEDLELQDLFDKDNGLDDGMRLDETDDSSGNEREKEEEEEDGHDDEQQHDPYELFETKIEIEEPQIQETILDEEYIGNELISPPSADEYDSHDEVLQSLNSSRAVQYQGGTAVGENDSPLENDHSYTTINIITPQPSDQEEAEEGVSSDDDGELSLRKLVTLSKKLAREGDVTSTGGKRTVQRIEKVVKSFLNRSTELQPTASAALLGKEASPSEGSSLSVPLSANCSERMEGDGLVPSTDGSHGRREDFGSDVDCAKGGSASSSAASGDELEELLELGAKFTQHYEQWLKKTSCRGGAYQKGSKAAQLANLVEKINRVNPSENVPSSRQDSSNAASTGNKVEIAIQTERSKDQHRNEQCKKRLLDSSSDSSSSSGSSSSSSSSSTSQLSGSGNSSSKRTKEALRHNRRLRKGAKEKRKPSSADERGAGKKRREQIYSDSSSDEAEKRSEDGGRAEGDENLLDGVLSGVDDIMSDVHDIIPDAVGVVQDFLDGEQQRQEREERSEETRKRSGAGAGKEPTRPALSKSVKDMTEAEREEYEDMQIERLCNISTLIGCRNAAGGATGSGGPASAASKSKESSSSAVKKKKDENNMEHFLNHENGSDDTAAAPLEPQSDESSESEKDVVETEEQFLQKCNETMKQQLLNQLSSSEETSDEEDNLDGLLSGEEEDDNSGDGRPNGTGKEDSDDSSAGSLVESFLKRHDSKLAERKERKKQPNERENGNLLTNGQADDSGDNAGGESSAEQQATKDSERAETPKKQTRTELANPKDKELFSNDLFDDEKSDKSGKTPRKRRKRINARKARGSDSERESSSADSDVEMLDGTPKKRQRKRAAPVSLETFDFSASLNASAAPRKGKTPATTAGEGSAIAKPSPSTLTPSGDSTNDKQAKTSSPAPSDPDATTTGSAVAAAAAATGSSTAGKQKGSKDGQDCISLSSDSSDDAELITGDLEENKIVPDKEPKRRIRAMLTNDELAEETKKAQKEEEGRTARLKKKHEQLKKFLASYLPGPGESELVLDYDSVRKQAICVHPEIVKLLKPHQIEGIKFMYDNTYGSVDALPKHSGSGCILAHCMGLGKTLQMISLLHTVMRYPQLMTNRVLVICPKSTVMNWKEEIARWQGTIRTGYQMKVYCFPDVCTQNDKIAVLKRWYYCKSPNCGVMLIGYEAFRALINYERRKGSVGLRSAKLGLIKEYLLNPGADLVICDEGHQIKNKRSAISEAVSKIKTRRRIMLTGTPIQNNLKEYYCMVNFIKPSFLGSDKEFSNLYANPIKNGQCKDSDHQSIKIMKQRSYVLHNKLSKFVQRKEAAVLKEFLPEKFEYVLFVPLTPVQEKMYEVFLQMNDYTNNDVTGEPGRTKKFKLIADYTSLRKIWTHPKVLEKAWESANLEKNRRDAARKTATPDSDDESPDDHNDIKSGQLSVTNDWWRQYLQIADLESLFPSNKLWILFEILKHCNERGEKVLIFTAFVSVLNMVEHFMAKIHHQEENPQLSDAYAYSAFKGPWEPGKDYYRLDGKTQKSIRHQMITSFNDPQNKRTKCFLISAKAGGQGINLTGANRVIILDTSWNPSNDQQNIFRIFRLGQKRKCYVYRLIAAGTMEEKVYSRSVTKQALSFRVVDEQQIDRHYSYGELAELYTLTKVSEMTRETPILPADDILASLLRTYPNKILKYHEHDSLLENKPEQDLSEEEKKEAWAAYEREIQNNENRSYLSQLNSMGAAAAAQLGGLLGSSAYGSPMAPYYASAMGYPGAMGLPMGGAGDMYRSDYAASYGSSMGRPPLYMQYAGSQQYSTLMNDPAFATAFAKMYSSFPLSGAGAMDYGMPPLGGHSSPMANGAQSMLPPIGPASSPGGGGASTGKGGGGGGYGTTSSLASMLSLLSGKSGAGASGLSSSALTSLSQSLLGGSSSSSLAELAAHHTALSSSGASPSAHYSPLKQMSDYAQSGASSLLSPNALQASASSGLSISNIASLQKANPPQPPPASKSSSGSSSSYDSVTKALFNRLTEQMSASALATAGVSSPFSPRTVPLLSPTLDNQPRSSAGGAFPLTASSPMTSNSGSALTVPISSSNSSISTPSLLSSTATALSLSIGQGPPKSTTAGEQPSNLVANNRSAGDSFAENRLAATPPASSLRSGPVSSAVPARTPTAVANPSEEEDKSRRTSTAPAKAQDVPNKRGTGNNFNSTPYSTTVTPSSATEPSNTNSGGKDTTKATKTLSNLAQQLPKPSTAKVPAKQSSLQTAVPAAVPPAPPIISNPMPSRLQLARANIATSVSSASTPAQQALAKSGALKPRVPSPTFKMTAANKQPTAASKPSPLSRSPLTVQTAVGANKKNSPLPSPAGSNKGNSLPSPVANSTGPLSSPATSTPAATPAGMRYMLSGSADQRTAATTTTTPITTKPAKSGISITTKPQQQPQQPTPPPLPAPTSVVSVTQPPTIVTTSAVGKGAAKAMAKPSPATVSSVSSQIKINPLNALAKQSGLGRTQTLSNTTTITAVKSAPAPAPPKSKPESRPMTVIPMKTSVSPLSGAGSRAVKKPVTTPTASTAPLVAATPKLTQLQQSSQIVSSVTAPPTAARTIATQSAVRPASALQKSSSAAKITPVTLLSAASMTGKLNNPPGVPGAPPRLPGTAASSTMVKTSLGSTPSTNSIQQQQQQPVLVSRPNPPISQINRTPAVINRAGKSPITINPAATGASTGGITITKSNSASIITPNPGPRVTGAAGASAPATTMTVIPTANIILPVSAAPGGVTTGSATVKANLPMGNIIRAGAAGSNSATTSLTAGVQPTPNSMIIRRRGIDSTAAKNAPKTLSSHLGVMPGTPPMKRPRLEDNTAIIRML